MADFQKENDDWKNVLRSEIITALTGSSQEKKQAYSQIGYYYLCSAPASLYKYYSDTSLKLETVRENKLWFSAPCNFNDVFDCDISIDEKELFNCVLKMLPDKVTIRPGSPMWCNLKGEMGQQVRKLKTTFKDLRETTGISCLSESDDSLLMWAHYADNHCGMCVEYNLLELNRQLSFTPVPVVYSDDRVRFCSLKPETVEKNSLTVFIQSITTKSLEWSYEREWRIIQDKGACGDRGDINNKGALLDMIVPSSVILGCEAKQEFEKAVKRYCEASKINLYKMEKDKALYRLNKHSILEFD